MDWFRDAAPGEARLSSFVGGAFGAGISAGDKCMALMIARAVVRHCVSGYGNEHPDSLITYPDVHNYPRAHNLSG